jgi:hypothetical protein
MTTENENDKLAKEIVSLKPMTEVVIDSDDADTIIDFFKTFKLKVSDQLKQAVEDFKAATKGSDLDHQLVTMNKLKLELAQAMSENTDNSIFSKRPFDLALACSKLITYNKVLDEQMEKSFSEE